MRFSMSTMNSLNKMCYFTQKVARYTHFLLLDIIDNFILNLFLFSLRKKIQRYHDITFN